MHHFSHSWLTYYKPFPTIMPNTCETCQEFIQKGNSYTWCLLSTMYALFTMDAWV